MKHKYGKAAADVAGAGLSLKHNFIGMAPKARLSDEAEEMIVMTGIAEKGFPRTRTVAKNLEHILDAFQTGGADKSKVFIVILEMRNQRYRRLRL